MKQTETPDIVKKYVLTTCPDCQNTLLQSPPLGIMKRQVFDIPPPKIEVTEHQAEVKYFTCCNKTVTALFPSAVRAPVQYGEVVRSWSVYAIPAERIKWLIKIYDKIIKQGLMFHTAQTPLPCTGKRGRQPKRTGHNLLLRLLHYKQDVLRFLHDPVVPFTNNDAERDLRMMKCKQKVSGGFRTTQGAEQFARIRGFISTVRKRGFNVLSSIQAIFSDNIAIPAGS